MGEKNWNYHLQAAQAADTQKLHPCRHSQGRTVACSPPMWAGWDLWAAWGNNLIIWLQPWCQLAKNSLASLKELQAISSLLSIAISNLTIAFMAFRNCSSILPMFLTAEIGNLVAQCTDVGCVLLQWVLNMQTAAKLGQRDCETPLSSSTCACRRTLERSLLLPFLHCPFNPSTVFCLWAVREFNLSLLTFPKEPEGYSSLYPIGVEWTAFLSTPWLSHSCL